MTFDIWFQMVGGFKCCCVTLHSTPTSARLWTFALCNFALHHLFNPSLSATRGFVKPEGLRVHVSHISGLLKVVHIKYSTVFTQRYIKSIPSQNCRSCSGTVASALGTCRQMQDYYNQFCNLLTSDKHYIFLCWLQPLQEVALKGFFCQPTPFRNKTSIFKWVQQTVGFLNQYRENCVYFPFIQVWLVCRYQLSSSKLPLYVVSLRAVSCFPYLARHIAFPLDMFENVKLTDPVQTRATLMFHLPATALRRQLAGKHDLLQCPPPREPTMRFASIYIWSTLYRSELDE